MKVNKFEPKDYALIGGQIVEIIEIKVKYYQEYSWYVYKIKLIKDNLTHWVDEVDLEQLPNQTTPKVLFSGKKLT